MRAEERLNGLHALARRVWDASMTVRVHYDPDDDMLVAEIVEAPATDEILVPDQLLVEFDGTDPDALPTTLFLTGVRAAPGTFAVALAREVLGAEVWAMARALVDGAAGPVDVELAPERAVALRASWLGLPDRLREHARTLERVIGVEFVAGRVHAVLADDDARILDQVVVDLDANDPDAVVEAVAVAARVLARRHPGTLAERCPLGVQLGGPVDTATGLVQFYDKPLYDGDETWKDVPLRDLLEKATGRRAFVCNDAVALAAHEIAFGLGRECSRFAILVVRQGVGAKLVYGGRVVDDFPMELGVFVPVPDADLSETPADRRRQSIETESGVLAIIAAVEAATGQTCATIEDAAALAERLPEAEQVFWNAGAGLARMMAAAQAIVNPEAWVVHGPVALVDDRAGARAFLGALAQRETHLDYSGFLPGRIEVRSLSDSLGARAAAIAVMNGGRMGATARPSDRE